MNSTCVASLAYPRSCGVIQHDPPRAAEVHEVTADEVDGVGPGHVLDHVREQQRVVRGGRGVRATP